jgi:D-lactate dehydrogenase (cytochrome)
MLKKTEQDEIQNYLSDASNMKGGSAAAVLFPESAEEIAEFLQQANKSKTRVVIAGAGTGLVGGRIPFGETVLALDKLNKIVAINGDADSLYGSVQAGVTLDEYQRQTAAKRLYYPPDPTEWSCQMGGTVATNASGSRSFKYGATRKWIKRLQIVLPTGDIFDLKRGELFFDANGRLEFQPENSTNVYKLVLPTFRMPAARKHAAGYYAAPGMDLIDLFIGSEGTLGVVTEIETRLLKKPDKILSGIVFFPNESDLLSAVKEARELSFAARSARANCEKVMLEALLLEYFDRNALDFVREKFPQAPEKMDGAIFFEQEVTSETEDALMQAWLDLLEKHNADLEKSWFAASEDDEKRLREFRHALPVAVNEWIVKHGQRKVSTDMAVPDMEFQQQLRFYQTSLQEAGLKYVIFGHIGDSHVHVNILPKTLEEATKAKYIYGRFIARTCMLGGTISAEHGVGKLKKHYLRVMYGERYINEMIAIKQSLDPNLVLGRGVMFDIE